MKLTTGVYFSIHGESYAEVGNPEKLWRDFNTLDVFYSKNKNGEFLDLSTLINNIQHTVKEKVYDISSFGKRTLEVHVTRKPYVKIESNQISGHKKEQESFYVYGGHAVFYVNTTPQLIYPSNLFNVLKMQKKRHCCFPGQRYSRSKIFLSAIL